MNIALNLLPTQATPTQPSTSKSSNSSSSKSQSKSSFSDTLDKAVAKSNEATTNEQQPVSANTPTENAATNNNSNKKDDTDSNQKETSDDSAASPKADSAANVEGALPPQAVLANIVNAAVTTQIPLAMPVVNMPNPQAAVAVQQPSSAITTAVTGVSPNVQAGIIAASGNNANAGNNDQGNQKQAGLINQVQAGQVTPEILEKLAGSITDVVQDSSSATVQPNSTQTAVNMQSQASKVEIAQNTDTSFLSQLNASVQGQAAVNGAVQNLDDKVSAQQAVVIPNQNGKAEPAQNVTSVQETQTSEVVIPIVDSNQQAGTLTSNTSGQEQKENLTDAATLKTSQELANKGTEATNSSTFAQNLDATLLAANGAAPTAKTAEFQVQVAPKPDVYQVVDQIVEQTKIITKVQNTEMVMKLKPEHLGELTLKVAVENGVVNASFHSNNPEVRSLIEASLPQLKQELANTGLKVDNVSVYAGLSQFQPNQGQERNTQQQLMKFTNKKSADDFVEAVEGEIPGGNIPGLGSQSGVDYRI